MQHQEVINREDGSRIRITVVFDSTMNYRITVEKATKKGKFSNVVKDTDIYKALAPELKAQVWHETIREHISAEELNDACLRVWEQLKPNPFY